MITTLSAHGLIMHTDSSLEDALEMLMNGKPLKVWHFESTGKRVEARQVFTEFEWVREEDD